MFERAAAVGGRAAVGGGRNLARTFGVPTCRHSVPPIARKPQDALKRQPDLRAVRKEWVDECLKRGRQVTGRLGVFVCSARVFNARPTNKPHKHTHTHTHNTTSHPAQNKKNTNTNTNQSPKKILKNTKQKKGAARGVPAASARRPRDLRHQLCRRRAAAP